MKTIIHVLLIFGLIFIISGLGILAAHRMASAQSGDGYDLTWNTAEGGGMKEGTGGGYSLTGTFGQTDASTTPLSGGTFMLEGGFWSLTIINNVFLPVITR